jgi:hypothetical protein
MEPATWDASGRQHEGTPIRLRFAFGAVVWRLTVLLLLLEEFWLWRLIRRRRPWLPRGHRWLRLLFFTPRLVVSALLIGALAAVAIDLVVRFLVQPLVRAWHHPPRDESAVSFHLASNEWVEESTPARRGDGRRWLPGTLVRTNRQVRFFPLAWDAEAWSLPMAELDQIWAEEAPKWGWGLISGFPDRICIQPCSGHAQKFAMADPHAALVWLAPVPAESAAAKTRLQRISEWPNLCV